MSKYEPLRAFLERSHDEVVTLTFAEVASLVGGLPGSAYTYDAWWANEPEGTHVQARAWTGAGRRAQVDRASRRVRFAMVARHSSLESKLPPVARVMPVPIRSANVVSSLDDLAETDLETTLVVMPCSKKKADSPEKVRGPSVLQHLPGQLAERLATAREQNRIRGKVDESTLLPAWRRYEGQLYRAAAPTLGRTADAWKPPVLIISGGYGVVRADEPIGWYDAVFNPDWWPDGIVGRSLVECAAVYGAHSVVAFAGSSTSYAQEIRRANWRRPGLERVILLTPIASRAGNQVKVPRAIGQAVSALLSGNLESGWTSSDGLSLASQILS